MADFERIAKTQAVHGEQISQITMSCEKIEECLLGNGKTGLVIRTDRLERKDMFKTKLFWVFASVSVAVLVKTIGIDLIGALAKASSGQ